MIAQPRAPRCGHARILLLFALAPGLAAADSPPPGVAFAPVGSYDTELGSGSAESAALAGRRVLVANGASNTLDLLDVSDPARPRRLRRIDGSPWGSRPTHVAARPLFPLFAVSFVDTVPTARGRVVTFDVNGNLVDSGRVGSWPDMLTFTSDGQRLVVANEGEPGATEDPSGSVSIVRVDESGQLAGVRAVAFTAFNVGGSRHDELPDGLHLVDPDATVAEQLEPESVAVSADSRTAWVTLQESNAVAVVDLELARVSAIHALGTKDHGQSGQGLDPSDLDGAIAIAPWPVHGLFQPDGIASFQVGAARYWITANEGAASEGEAVRLGEPGYALDPEAFPDAEGLRQPSALGRLHVSAASGDGDGDGLVEQIHAFGARSFAIWDDAGARVYDSGDALESITARFHPEAFNADRLDNAFDARSDDRGPEPEALEVARIGRRTYAFVGLERVGGVVIFDVSDPATPRFAQYTNARDFEREPAGPDSGPATVRYVPYWESPTFKPLLLMSNDGSGTVTLYELRDPDGADVLSLLHAQGARSSLRALVSETGEGPLPVGGAAAFASVLDREVAEARAARHSVLALQGGDALGPGETQVCSEAPEAPRYDALAQREIAWDAHAFGEHDFDGSPDGLERFVRGVDDVRGRPFLSANLEFGFEPGFADLLVPGGLFEGERAGPALARSAIRVDRVTGARVGLVAAAPPSLPRLSAPRGVAVAPSLAGTAEAVQGEIDRLREDHGLRKLILVSHLEDVESDRALVRLLRGVDLAVAAGGDALWLNDSLPLADQILPGELEPVSGSYPLLEMDGDGRSVPIVASPGRHRYLGRLDVRFDRHGELEAVVGESSFLRRVVPDGPEAQALGVADAVAPDAEIDATVIAPLEACVADLAQPFAESELPLDVSSDALRARESNAGNLVADALLAAYDRHAESYGLPPRGPDAPTVALQPAGGIGQDAGDVLPVGGTLPGAISRRDTLAVLGFVPQSVSVVGDVAPEALKEILETAAASLPAPSADFLQVAGLRVVYDPAGAARQLGPGGEVVEAGARVVEARLDEGAALVEAGAPVPGAPSVRVVAGRVAPETGDAPPWLADAPSLATLPSTLERALAEYLASFPPAGGLALPTLPAGDVRYAPGGAGRIAILPVLEPAPTVTRVPRRALIRRQAAARAR